MFNSEETNAFQRKLVATLEYQTPRGPAWRLGPLEWVRSLCFHVRLVWVYVGAWKIIRKGNFDLAAYANRSWKALSVAEACGGRFEVSGLAHLAATPGPVVIIANHMSSLETVALSVLIMPFKDVAFVVKESLRTHFIFGPIMRAVKHIAVGRSNPREDLKIVLTRGEELLRQGVSVVIFPQATRSAEFDIEGFNTLGVKLAARAGVPVIPLALKTDFMANGVWIKDMGFVHPERTIHFTFGAPLTVVANGREEHAAVVKFIATHVLGWGGTVKGKVPS
jgi:1-acyl-sn-glycerol-3-phosphate acyltransferase